MRLTLTPALRAFLESRLASRARGACAGAAARSAAEVEREVGAALDAGHVSWSLLKDLYSESRGDVVCGGGSDTEGGAEARDLTGEKASRSTGDGDAPCVGAEAAGGGEVPPASASASVPPPPPPAVSLRAMCRGSSVYHAPLPDRVSRQTPEFRATLARLRADLERKEYERMVRPAEAAERRAREAAEGGLSSYRKAGSLGLHIGLTMAALFAFGWYTAGTISSRHDARLAGGLVGAIVALLVESTLFVIRTSAAPTMHVEAAKHALRRKLEHERKARERAERKAEQDILAQGGGAEEREAGKSRLGDEGRAAGGSGEGKGVSSSSSSSPPSSSKAPTLSRRRKEAPGSRLARNGRGEEREAEAAAAEGTAVGKKDR